MNYSEFPNGWGLAFVSARVVVVDEGLDRDEEPVFAFGVGDLVFLYGFVDNGFPNVGFGVYEGEAFPRGGDGERLGECEGDRVFAGLLCGGQVLAGGAVGGGVGVFGCGGGVYGVTVWAGADCECAGAARWVDGGEELPGDCLCFEDHLWRVFPCGELFGLEAEDEGGLQ